MAASQAPTALSYPTAGSADPFTAAFYANQAALMHSEQLGLAGDQRNVTDTNAAYEYNRGNALRAEPLKVTANQNNANLQGLTESGVLAKAQSQTQIAASEAAHKLAEARSNAINKYQENERNLKQTTIAQTNKEVAAETERQVKEQEENPAKPETPAPAPAPAPAAPPVVLGQSPQPVTGSGKAAPARKAAIKKITKGVV